ncbi:MAG: LolA-like putative outer membrane lipoprotein chaperone [Bacteroidaceae bacterium]|nr:LolA-like putative outer membrane lipoprotein chaperone [Bacteroidaceae bacterium]
MKRYIILLLAMTLTLVSATAQSASNILDTSASALKSAGNTRIDFTADVNGASGKGYIKIQGQKFVLNLGDMITWFNGKTMWNYVRKNEEVTVTEPSPSEIAKINPYSFLHFYKKGYKATMGKSTSRDHEVILQSEGNAQYKKVILHINRKTNYPSSISMTTSGGQQVTIRCTEVKSNQKFTASTFQFNQKKYPDAEVVDLR